MRSGMPSRSSSPSMQAEDVWVKPEDMHPANKMRTTARRPRFIQPAPHAEEHSCRPSRRALWALLRMRQLCVSKHAGRLYAGHDNRDSIYFFETALRQFDAVD